MTATIDSNLLLIGHSMISPRLPTMLNSFIKDAGGSGRVDYQIINGAPLRWQWDHSHEAEGVDSKRALATGDYDVVVLTEALPLVENITWNDSDGYALRFFNAAVENNPQAQVYLYEVWQGFSLSGNNPQRWRDAIERDIVHWEGIVEEVNANRPAGTKPMLVIPVGQAMVKLFDAIEAGEVPGIDSVRDLVADDIHPSDLGMYFAAMVYHATIYGTDPDSLPEQTWGQWGEALPAPSAELADVFQRIAWETVAEYELDGVDVGSSEPDPDVVRIGTAMADTLVGRSGDDSLKGLDGADSLFGDSGDDKLWGGAGDDRLDGGDGADTLFGGSGDDRIDGGSGSDVLRSGGGDDTLIGGADSDRFIFRDSWPEGSSRITDYEVGTDVLVINGSVISDATTAEELGDLGITLDQASDGSLVIRFGEDSSVTLSGVTEAEFWG